MYTPSTYIRVFTIDITSIYINTRKCPYCIIIDKVLLKVGAFISQGRLSFLLFGAFMREGRLLDKIQYIMPILIRPPKNEQIETSQLKKITNMAKYMNACKIKKS